jgi:hypothetical protein
MVVADPSGKTESIKVSGKLEVGQDSIDLSARMQHSEDVVSVIPFDHSISAFSQIRCNNHADQYLRLH